MTAEQRRKAEQRELAEAFCQRKVRRFTSDAEILRIAAALLELRCEAEETCDDKERRKSEALCRRVRKRFHRALRRSTQGHIAAAAREAELDWLEREILLALTLSAVGMRELIFDIDELIRALACKGDESLAVVQALQPERALVAKELVRVYSYGIPVTASVRPTPAFLQGVLGRPAAAAGYGCGAAVVVRDPVVRLETLALAAPVQRAVDLILTQTRSREVLFGAWGMDKAVPYGRAVSALFAGPPGVGKTATAEAIAAALGRPVAVVDYARMQSCWVGDTEKNIVQAFDEAKRREAVLVWDEADAMFYDRAVAARAWEVREVNVLLQTIERFEGVCILCTNRGASLDPALMRRLAVKVEFPRPDRDLRQRIWQALLPAALPLAEDVRLDGLAAYELTGGEIKNVLLNAARLALNVRPQGPVAMADFDAAVRLETQGSEESGPRIGFGRSQA